MRAGIFGRDAELARIEGFLAELPLAAGALVLGGPSGTGKTTLLQAAVADAGPRGYLVLEARPSPGELRLAFAGLSDLLEDRLDTVLDDLPPPQRRALAVALLRADAPARPGEPRIVAAAFRNALAALARSAPVLVVIDDLHWLDPPTEVAVAFAFRRLDHEHVGLICASRAVSADTELPLDLGRARLAADVLPLGGLSLGALHHLLRLRLGTSFSHLTLRRIEAESGGNPFIALEIGRALARRGISRAGTSALPVPDTLNGLVDERLRELTPGVIEALRVVAVMPEAPISRYLSAGLPGADIDAAVLAGLLAAEGSRLRFSHPLLASAVAGSIPPARLRELHSIAATSSMLPEERVRHRALATDGSSAGVAAELEAAARTAEARGAPSTAAELFELAAAMTPARQPDEEHRRLLAAARQLAITGETRAAAALLEQLVAAMPAGPGRAEALGQLAAIVEDDFGSSARLLGQALAEAGDDPALAADIHLVLSDISQATGHLTAARTAAHRALECAELVGDPALLASSLAQAFLLDWMCGADPDASQLDRALELESAAHSLLRRTPPSLAAGQYHLTEGRLEQGEEALRRALARAEADGVEYWQADALLRLSLCAGWRGELHRAAELASAGLLIAEQLDLGQLTSALLYAGGVAALQLGLVDDVREAASRGLELSRAAGERTYEFYHLGLLGSLELAVGDYPAAVARLAGLTGRLALDHRSLTSQTVTADAVEALIATGQLDPARELLGELERSPLGTAISAALTARCRGALAAASGDLGAAIAELDRAVQLHDRSSPQPVQRGRTLLVLGGLQRRLRRRRAARETIVEAVEIFTRTGAVLWAERGRAELARISGRAPGTGELSGTELRVAELIARGMSNREAAAELFVTVRTVESALTKLYLKLGVHSRTQLADLLHRSDRVR
jgi:ATP/maltotriose-dependent transcriptional regulator MalT